MPGSFLRSSKEQITQLFVQQPGAGHFQSGHPHTTAGIHKEPRQYGSPIVGGCRPAITHQPVGGAQRLNNRSLGGILQQRPEPRQILRASHSTDGPGRPGSNPGIWITLKDSQLFECFGQRIAGQGIGSPRPQTTVRRFKTRQCHRQSLPTRKSKQGREQPLLDRRHRQLIERPPHCRKIGVQPCESFYSQAAGLRIWIPRRPQQRPLRPLIPELAEAEGRCPTNLDLPVDEQPLQGRPSSAIADTPQSLSHRHPQTDWPLLGDVDYELVIELAVGKQEQECPLLQMGKHRLQRLDDARRARNGASLKQNQAHKMTGQEMLGHHYQRSYARHPMAAIALAGSPELLGRHPLTPAEEGLVSSLIGWQILGNRSVRVWSIGRGLCSTPAAQDSMTSAESTVEGSSLEFVRQRFGEAAGDDGANFELQWT